MTIYNLGSINADHIYNVPHLPQPGETLTANNFVSGLGGKGINQSVAAVFAGSNVVHIGAVGSDGQWAVDKVASYGIDTRNIETVDAATGHAIITVDEKGENAIVIFPGANHFQNFDQVAHAMQDARAGDILLLQNETTLQAQAAKYAQYRGLKVIYSAAPFSITAVKEVLDKITILLMNKVESEQLSSGLETKLIDLFVPEIIVTKGADGVDWLDSETGEVVHMPSFPVTTIDTTAAGDTFAGYFASGLDQGLSMTEAMRFGSAAAAIKVTRMGTADAIPMRDEVNSFLKKNRI